MRHLAVECQNARKNCHHAGNNDEDQTAEANRQPGLQQQLIEIDYRQSIVAAAGQTALAPQLHEHALAVSLVGHHLETAVAVGRIAVHEQIYALCKHRRREADEDVEQVDRIEIGHGRSERLRGVEIVAGNLDAQICEMRKEPWACAGRLEVSLYGAVSSGTGAHEFEDFLHLDDQAAPAAAT